MEISFDLKIEEEESPP